MNSTLASRTLDGVEIPAPGVWDIDPAHSTVGFVVRHLVVAKVRGRFGSFAGAITIADEPELSSASVTIDAASIDTRQDGRDEHLRSPDFFDVANYPVLTFETSALKRTSQSTFELSGDLTIRGTTRPVVLRTEFDGVTLDTQGGSRAAFTATTEIDRNEYGLTWNQVLEAGGVAVSNKVKIELEISLVRRV